MIKLTNISLSDFFHEFNVKEIDLLSNGFFSIEDLVGFGSPGMVSSEIMRVKKILDYTPFVFRNPNFLKSFIFPTFLRTTLGKFIPLQSEIDIISIIKRYNLRASIVAAFKPKNILEIGTYFGWSAASFKFVVPNCNVYTINPKYDRDSNNPIDKKDVGSICTRKGLKVKQIRADSTNMVQ